jgi:hypothetical protein
MPDELLVSMDQDGMEPRGKPTRAVKSAQAAPGFDQCFCHQIFGGLEITAQPSGFLVEPLFMVLGQGAKGIRLALTGAGQQLRILSLDLGVHRHGHQINLSHASLKRFAGKYLGTSPNQTTPEQGYAHCAHEPQNAQVFGNQGRHFQVHEQNWKTKVLPGSSGPAGLSVNRASLVFLERGHSCPPLWSVLIPGGQECPRSKAHKLLLPEKSEMLSCEQRHEPSPGSASRAEGVKELALDTTSDIASITGMGYFSKLQVIQRGRQNRQFYLICPAPVAAALELQKGEALEWIIKDRDTFEIHRVKSEARSERSHHE